KVNDLVTVWGSIVLSNNGSATGDTTITGLPYAAATLSGLLSSGAFGKVLNIDVGSVTTSSGGNGVFLTVGSGASSISVWLAEGDGQDDYVNLNQGAHVINDTAQFHFSLTYRTDANTDGGSTGTFYFKL